jgi:hypothetical protein
MLSKEKRKKLIQKLKQGDLIEVKWIDHAGELGWRLEKELTNRQPYICTSIGYYIGINDFYLTTANCYDPQGYYNGMHFTVPECIYNIRKIKN